MGKKLMIDGVEVMHGQSLKLHEGMVTVVKVYAPTKRGSTGRVAVRYADGQVREYYPSVIGAKWVDDLESLQTRIEEDRTAIKLLSTEIGYRESLIANLERDIEEAETLIRDLTPDSEK